MALTMIDPASSWFEIVELPLVIRLTTKMVSGREKVSKELIFDKSSNQIARLVSSLTTIWVWAGTKKLLPRRIPTVRLTPNTTNPQTSPPWWCRLPLLPLGIVGYAQSNAGDLFRRGWPRASSLGLIQIVKITA
jgi:hypothetical protein